MFNARPKRQQRVETKSNVGLINKYAKYKTYIIVGALIVVSTAVLGGLGGAGIFNSSSSSSDEVDVPDPSPSSTGANAGSSSTGIISVSSSSTTSNQPVYQFLASSLSGLANASAVASWTGTDGVDIVVQNTPSARPMYVSDGLGGLPAIYFDGTKRLVGVGIFPTNTPFTMIMVIKNQCEITYCNVVSSSSVVTQGSYATLLTGDTSYGLYAAISGTFLTQSPASIARGATKVIAFVYNVNTFSMYINGALAKVTQDISGANLAVTDSSICIGCTSNPSDYMFKGYMSVAEGYNSVIDVAARSASLMTTYSIS